VLKIESKEEKLQRKEEDWKLVVSFEVETKKRF
jgi:hypothetical protein